MEFQRSVDAGEPRTPWEELAQQAHRTPQSNRDRVAERDHALRAAVRAGSSVRELAERMGISVQAVYQAVERADQELAEGAGSGYRQALAALQGFTDAVAFEELANLLLAEFKPDLRPTQRSADRGRDAVAGPSNDLIGEPLVVTVSLQKDWAAKVRKDMERLKQQGLHPEHVFAVTNREADENRLKALRAQAVEHGWTLTVFDGRWLANALSRPEHAQLRREYLGLDAPRPRLFLNIDEFEALLRAAHPQSPRRLVGREAQLDALATRLAEGKTVILEAAGGMGKSRLVVELARREDRWHWLFVRDGLPFSPEALHEVGVGDEAAVVVDDAHRRGDLRALLAGLERRNPSVRLVLICRLGFVAHLERELEGLAHGPVARMTLPLLPRADMAKLLEEPPLHVRFGGLRAAIVELAQGNPQLATIAAELSGRGLALHELSGDELMRSYVAAVLREAAGDSRERLGIMALVAAVGQLEVTGKPLVHAGELLGLTGPHIRREVADLADRGMVVEEGGRAFIKPDLLAERILVGCFFDRSWRPALDYAEIHQRFGPLRRREMLSVLGQSLHSATEEARGAPALQAVRSELLDACARARSADARRSAVDDLAAVAPGLPALASDGFDLLMDGLGSDPDGLIALCGPLLEVVGRSPEFAGGWERLLMLSQRVFSVASIDDPVIDGQHAGSDPAEQAVKQLSDAFARVHSRLPVDQSPYDARVLAGVQEAMAQITPAWWRGERGHPGAAHTALLASRVLLTVIYEITRADAANPMQINMISVGVPASESTERCLTAGVRLLLGCVAELPLGGQMRAIETLRNLAHPALDFSGPFGLRLSAESQSLINRLFDELVQPWVAAELANLPLPVAAEALELFEWRTYFGRPGAQLRERQALRAYRELVHPSRHWDLDDDTVDAQRDRHRRVAARHAETLLRDDSPLMRLDRWRGWYDLRCQATGDHPWHEMLSFVFEQVVIADLEQGVVALDHLLDSDSPLLAHATAGMIAALERRPQLALRWIQSPSDAGRAALAWAAPHLDEGLQRQVFETLAADDSRSVRNAAARALRHRTELSDWRTRVALQLVTEDNDLHVLVNLLESVVDDAPMEQLSDAEVDRVRTALMRAADELKARESYPLAEALRLMRQLGHDLLWDWVWRRVERVDTGGRLGVRMADALPDHVMELVADDAGDSTSKVHTEHALQMLERPERSNFLVEQAVISLVVKLDHHDLVVERVAGWARGTELQRHRLKELLEAVSGWERFEEYAAAALAGEPSSELVHMVVWSREPTSFMGSRVPYYEAVRDEFADWRDSSDGNLVRAALHAQEYFDARIAEARAEEQRRLEAYS